VDVNRETNLSEGGQTNRNSHFLIYRNIIGGFGLLVNLYLKYLIITIYIKFGAL